MGFTCKIFGHKWILLENKCIEKCSICGKERSVEHKWSGSKCERCDASRGHEWMLLENKNVIRKIALEDEDKYVLITAIELLGRNEEDQKTLLKIALTEEDFFVWARTLDRLRTDNLIEVIQNVPDHNYSYHAYCKLVDPTADGIAFWWQIIKDKTNVSEEGRKKAILEFIDSSKLARNEQTAKIVWNRIKFFADELCVDFPMYPNEHENKNNEFQYQASTFDEKKSLKLVSDYIDENPMQKLSKEEIEMMKPFFAELFMWYKNNTEGKSLANECSRCGCRINDDDLIFLSGSGRLFCKDCGLQYVISNLSDWHYYLGNIDAGIGYVPTSIQKKGLELQEKMTVERNLKNQTQISAISDQNELFKIVMNPDEVFEVRDKAINKISNPELLKQIALKCKHSSRHALTALAKIDDQSVFEKLSQKENAYNIREAAIRRLTNQQMIANIAKYDEKRDLRALAIRFLTDEDALHFISQNDLIEYVREDAINRLQQLKK
ncbi:MAG: hypothetical protein FWD60_08855 [Candidatus Azobacteroides sp.]|nr:hypothetical protein [Candidatus Azobacteroides sp.]